MLSGNAVTVDSLSGINSFGAAADTVEELVPDRVDVRTKDEKWLILEPEETKHGMLISGEVNELLDEVGFEFESTGKHVECSHANHWYKFQR